MSMDDIHPRLQEVVEELAELRGMTASQMRQGLERQLGLELAEVDDEDAEAFADAVESQDGESAAEILEKYDVPEDVIVQVQSTWADGGGDPRGNGETPPAGDVGGGEGLDRDEVREMIAQEVPDASQIAGELQSQMGATGGGGGGGGQPAQGGEQDQGAQLGQLISLAQMFGGGGGGASAALGEKVQEAALESFLRDLQKPSFGDMLEAKYYEEALGSDTVQEMYGDLMPDGEDDAAAKAMGFGGSDSDDDDDDSDEDESLVVGE